MKIATVQEFIRKLRDEEAYKDLLQKLLPLCQGKEMDQTLDLNDAIFLQKAISEYLLSVQDTPLDFMAADEQSSFRQEALKFFFEVFTLGKKCVTELNRTDIKVFQSFFLFLTPNIKKLYDSNTFKKLVWPENETGYIDHFILDNSGTQVILLEGLAENIKRFGKNHHIQSLVHYPWNATIPRALTVRELARIKLKNSKIFENYRPLFSTGKNRPIPGVILASLLQLINDYYHPGITDFYSSFIHWQTQLVNNHPYDLNEFYGQNYSKDYFLIDILIKCYGSLKEAKHKDGSKDNKEIAIKNSIREEIKMLAECLAKIDPIYISYTEALQPIYKSLNIGRAFTRDALKENLERLLNNESNEGLRQSIHDLIQICSGKKSIDTEIVQKIRGLYEKKWHLTHKNEPSWIRLAKILQGAKHIPDYVHLLMPVKHYFAIDHILGIPLWQIPLEHLIVTEDGESLIALEASRTAFFSYWTSRKYRYIATEGKIISFSEIFTDVEIERLRRSKQFSWLAKRGVCNESGVCSDDDELRITKETVSVIANTAKEMMHIPALEPGVNYPGEEYDRANNAIEGFFKYLEQMEKEERARLDAQIVVLNNQAYNFAQFLYSIYRAKNGNTPCPSVVSLIMVKLVLDYDPDYSFSDIPGFEDTIKNHQMRKKPTSKKFYEKSAQTQVGSTIKIARSDSDNDSDSIKKDASPLLNASTSHRASNPSGTSGNQKENIPSGSESGMATFKNNLYTFIQSNRSSPASPLSPHTDQVPSFEIILK